jgi:hypothetical protein
MMPPLWSAFGRHHLFLLTVAADFLSQELFYQIQHSSVCDALSHEGHETVVRDVVKVSFNIDIHYVVMAALEKSFDFSQGVLATASGPKSIAGGCELAFASGN